MTTKAKLSRRHLVFGVLGVSVFTVAGCTTQTAQTLGHGKGLASLDFALWAGVPGARYGDKVDTMHGSRRIEGPIQWKHPITGEAMQVYARTNVENKGKKVQYYALRSDGTALGRVYDRRPGQADRYFINDAFVPFGAWWAGQSRTYNMTEHQNGMAKKRQVTLRIIKSNYKYRRVPGSVKFDWIAKDSNGRTIFHERYVYSPGVGFADFDNRLK